MGFFTIHNKFRENVRQHSQSSSHSSSYSQPNDKATNEPCHCVNDEDLEYRYNMLRVEEHARTDGLCGDEWSKSISKLPENHERNRYSNISPWNHSRVKLPVKPGKNDYINASWIQLGSKTYIACQGPLLNTTEHFWHMAYAYGGSPVVIVMLTSLHENSVEKCFKYWPDSKNDTLHYPNTSGDFDFGLTVTFEKATQNDHYNYSQFTLTPDNHEYPARIVHHIYYHSWSDFKKPNFDADLRSLIYFLNNKLKNAGAPPIVHCSAGIGRTGTFIALDSLLSKIDVDIVLSHAPETSPVWRMDPASILRKSTPFIGQREHHMNLETGSIISTAITDNMSSPPSVPQTPDVESIIAISKIVPRSGPQVSALSAALRLPLSEATTPGEATPQALESAAPSENQSKSPESVAEPEPESEAESPLGSGSETKMSITDNASIDFDVSVDNSIPALDLSTMSPPNPPKIPSSVDARTGPAPSSKTGPILTRKLTTYRPTEDFYEQGIDAIDVVDWYEQGPDVVLSAIRCMRLQRPKMVQGTSQLGYIYDQYEVGLQLAKACCSNADKDCNSARDRLPRRSQTENFTESLSSSSGSRNGLLSSSFSSDRAGAGSIAGSDSARSGRRPQRSNTLSSLQNFFTTTPSSRHLRSQQSSSQEPTVKRKPSIRS